MKIVVRQEPADSGNAPGKTVVWIVGDDGETRETSYLEGGQQLPIETTPGSENYSFGPVEETTTAPEAQQDAPPPAQDPPLGEEPSSETLNAPEGSVEGAPASEAQEETPQTD